jgi:hypothetical protein
VIQLAWCASLSTLQKNVPLQYNFMNVGYSFKTDEFSSGRVCKPDKFRMFINGKDWAWYWLSAGPPIDVCTARNVPDAYVDGIRLSYFMNNALIMNKGIRYDFKFRLTDGGDGRKPTIAYIGTKSLTLSNDG